MVEIRTKDGFCLGCGGFHEPDSDGSYVIFRDYRFTKPFRCICCGREICGRQFAFGRACGLCDTGACQPWNRAYSLETAHEHPEWWSSDGRQMFEQFVKTTGATKEPTEAID